MSNKRTIWHRVKYDLVSACGSSGAGRKNVKYGHCSRIAYNRNIVSVKFIYAAVRALYGAVAGCSEEDMRKAPFKR